MTLHDERRRREIDEELEAHLQARTEHLVAQGLTPEQARREALARFGDFPSARAALHAQAVRTRIAAGTSEYFHQWWTDLRYVARTIHRSPAFSLGVIALFALGLGVNAAVFRVAYDLLLRAPEGVAAAGGIRRVETLVSFGGEAPSRATLYSYPDARLLVGASAWAEAAMYTAPRIGTTSTGREVSISEVDGHFFRVLGVDPVAGRHFSDDEVKPGADLAVAIVSDKVWQQLYPGRSLSAEAEITLGTRAHRIVGVLPRGFIGIDIDPIDVWLPLGVAQRGRGVVNGVPIAWYQTEMLRALRVIGRTPTGVGETGVAEQLSALLTGTRHEEGRPIRTAELRSIVPVGDAAQAGASRQLVRRLMFVSLIVLVIASANATNLLLAHSLGRQQEVAIRLAIGAGRARVIRLVVLHSVLLAGAGAIAATLLGHWTAQGLWRTMFPDGRGMPGPVDLLSVTVTLAVGVLAGLIAGLAPAWQATRPGLVDSLRTNRALGHRRSRLTRAVLVVGQTALSLTLVVLSGLLVLSLMRLGGVRLGFAPEGLVTASIVRGLMEPPGAPGALTVESLTTGMPQASVAFATVAPFGATSTRDIRVLGSTFVPESPLDQPRYADVSPNYFEVMGTKVVEGRGLTAEDTAGSDRVAVVNASMKRAYWGDRIPSGACILIDTCARVVGVVEDVLDAPGVKAPLRYYLPLAQAGRVATVAVVRATAPDAVATVGLLRAATPPGQRVVIDVIPDRIARALRPWRTATMLFLTLGVVGLLLASVGLYSVVNYLASARLQEFGVRVVLGATRDDVVALVFRDGTRLLAVGSVLGLMGAALSGRYLGSLLFDVSPFDPMVYLAGWFGMGVAAVIAMWAPARRAARVNPVLALRGE